jgi:hypothetical protein
VDASPVPQRRLTGLEGYETRVLVDTARRLLHGLTKVAHSLHDGTFAVVGERGKAPPSQSGQLTLGLLVLVNEELVARGHDTIFKE